MSKTFLHKIFGLGKIPKRMLPAIEQEGIVLIDEGISGSIKFKNFRAPGRRYSRKYSWFTGAIVLTQKRFAAFTFYPFFNPIINVPLDAEQLNKLDCSLKKETTLCVLFDPSDFRELTITHKVMTDSLAPILAQGPQAFSNLSTG